MRRSHLALAAVHALLPAVSHALHAGQRRRVSIGCELVLSPTIMFLDEPTSGLDAASAYYVVNTVRQLAQGCRTIVSVIHQPSSEVGALTLWHADMQ
jgi:ABC-type multidrug transport system ATPase subunit